VYCTGKRSPVLGDMMTDQKIFYTGVGICLLSGLASILNIFSDLTTGLMAIVGIFLTGIGYMKMKRK
jgi:hypothetical protein